MVDFSYAMVDQLIYPQTPETSFTCQELINSIREQEASDLGIAYPQIARASGKESLGGGVTVGITIYMLDNWQIAWYAGSYTAMIGGGNLTAECGDAVAYVEGGPQVEITLSAAATIVSMEGAVPTAEDNADAVRTAQIEGTYTIEQALRLLLAAAMGKTTIATGPPVTVTFRDVNDTKNRITGQMDGSERTNVSLDAE